MWYETMTLLREKNIEACKYELRMYQDNQTQGSHHPSSYQAVHLTNHPNCPQGA